MSALLRVEDLRTYLFVKRGVVKAVDGISFSIDAGETLGLVGESGSGKTITGLSLLKLHPQPGAKIVSGRILLDGEDLVPKNERAMRKIRGCRMSMILQDPLMSLNPAYTVGDQVGEPISYHRHMTGNALRETAIESLRLVKIPSPESRIKAYPHQMSGGMRQRVAGAIALAGQPHLLIADEPTTSLDVTIQAQYLDLLKEVQVKSKVGMLFITHDLGIVALICDKVAVMYAGKIVESADTRELFNNSVHPYTSALMRCVLTVDGKHQTLTSIPGQPPDPCNLPAGCGFAPRCDKAMEMCRRQYPPNITIKQGHNVSCWLATKP